MRRLFLILSISASCLAAKQSLSKTPVSTPYYMNMSLKNCDDACLYDLLYDGLYLSYLSRYQASNDEKLYNYYSKLSNGIDYLTLPKRNKVKNIKIAVVLPESDLKSYSSNIASPVLAYLIASGQDANMKVFYTGHERCSSELISQLKDYSLIITGFHTQELLTLANALPNAKIYSPLAKAEDFAMPSDNIYFGSIDYDEQIAKLSAIATSRVGVFKDHSALSTKLTQAVENNKNIIFSRTIEHKDYNVAAALNGAYSLNGASVFFNLPLVKTTLIATQMRALNIKARNFLSTQINYHPMFLNLIQANERDKFYFTSIIDEVPMNIEYFNELLGQKINYNWIAYSTSAGLDSLFVKTFDAGDERLFKDEFQGRKMIFSSKIISAKNSKFSEIQ